MNKTATHYNDKVVRQFAIMTIMERKGLGRIQNRYGPNRVGPFGFLQPAADGIKLFFKEELSLVNKIGILFGMLSLMLVKW